MKEKAYALYWGNRNSSLRANSWQEMKLRLLKRNHRVRESGGQIDAQEVGGRDLRLRRLASDAVGEGEGFWTVSGGGRSAGCSLPF